MKLSHISGKGEAQMVDVSGKSVVHREAVATGRVLMEKDTIKLIKKDQIKKGDVLSVARIAAINGAKKTSELIPLCHNIPLNNVDVRFSIEKSCIAITGKAVCDGRTGVEMEALTAVSIAALTIYDMCKAVDKNMVLTEITLKEKTKHAVQD